MKVDSPPLDHFSRWVRWITHDLPRQRREIVLATLASRLRSDQAGQLMCRLCHANTPMIPLPIGSQFAESGAGLPSPGSVGAILVAGPDTAADLLVCGPGVPSEPPDAATTDPRVRLLQSVHRELAGEGYRFVQSMTTAESHQPLLANCGYQPLATLDYLVSSVRPRSQSRSSSRSAADEHNAKHAIRFTPFELFFGGPSSAADPSREDEKPAASAEHLEALVNLVDATYVDSHDCPAIAQFRTTEEMLRSYQRAAHHDPVLWMVAHAENRQPLGCLLVTPQPTSGILELTYMGWLRQVRGQRLGDRMIDRTWEIADRLGLCQVTLAVDRANQPAVRLYQRNRFDCLLSETVWGRSLTAGE